MKKPSQTAYTLLLSTSSRRVFTLPYLVYVPPEYNARQEKRWPLVLFLHASSVRGNRVHLVKRQGLPQLIEKGENFPFILVSPQCPASQWWTQPYLQQALVHLLNEIEKTYAIDSGKIYVTGLSMGGSGTWSLACNNPERFAAIAPICAPAEDLSKLAALRDLPVWAFQGDQDTINPLSEMLTTVHALKAYGSSVRLTVYPGVGHDAATPAYADRELYRWLLNQQLKSREKNIVHL